MKFLHRIRSVVDWILHRSAAEQRLDDELQSFLDMSVAEKVADGLSPAEARRLAKLELGGVEQVKEHVRTERHGGGLDEVGRDVRYAFRLFLKNRAFTCTVVLTLALGIGANTAIFSLIDALMLRWLPVRNPQELLQVWLRSPGATQPGGESLSYPMVRALGDQRDIFSGVAGFSGRTFDVGTAGSMSRVHGALVTGGYYSTLGLNPVVGRLLTDDDDRVGAPLNAVISYGYWQREFAGSPQAVGQPLRIKGKVVTVVGVTPRGFAGATVGDVADITIAVAALPQMYPTMAPLLGRGNVWLRALVRLNPGVSIDQATLRLNVVWSQIADSLIEPGWPASERKHIAESVFRLTPGGTGWSYLRRIYQKPLYVLMGAVALVLLIACANVATLLLARASARQKEIAVRLAIGASRARVIRQLLIESTMLSLIGAAVGVFLARVLGSFLVRLISTDLSTVNFDLTPNGHVLAFSSAAAIVTGILFGMAPAIQATAVNPIVASRENLRTTAGSRSRVLPFLVVAQVALSLVLLAAAGLFGRTLKNLESLDPGFRTEGVLLVELADQGGPIPATLVDEIGRLPGVLSATVSTHTPLNGWTWSEPLMPAGQPLPERDNTIMIGAGPRFFSTLQIQLIAGREFTERDRDDAAPVAIVNETYVARHFPKRSPVGEHLSTRSIGGHKDFEIVGVVRNTKLSGLRADAPPTAYVAYYQLDPKNGTSISVRAVGPLGEVSSAIRQSLQPKFPNTPIEVRALSTQVANTIAQERMMAMLAGGFAVLALALACIGIYGLLAYSVSQRTKEIGIRMALGAQASRVVASVVTGGARLVAIAVLAGLPAVWFGVRWIESLLFGVTPLDPLTIVGAIVVLSIAAQLAAYLPARRASRVHPLEALRHE
jgi:putative ABC transport system permease protein